MESENDLEHLHEDHLKSLQICSIANNILCELLAYYLVNQDVDVNGTIIKLSSDKSQALSQLFQLKPELIKTLTSLKYKEVREIFYGITKEVNGKNNRGKEKKKKQKNPESINFNRIDVSLCIDLLRNIAFFPTCSDENHPLIRSIKIIGKLRILSTHNLDETFWEEVAKGTFNPIPQFEKNNTLCEILNICCTNIYDIGEFLVHKKHVQPKYLEEVKLKLENAQNYTKPNLIKFNSAQIYGQWTLYQYLRELLDKKKKVIESLELLFNISDGELNKSRQCDWFCCWFWCCCRKKKSIRTLISKDIGLDTDLSNSVQKILEDIFQNETGEKSSGESYEIILHDCRLSSVPTDVKYSEKNILFEVFVKRYNETNEDLLNSSSDIAKTIRNTFKNQLNKYIKEEMDIDASVIFNRWKPGSLVIQGSIFKTSQIVWDSTEIDTILPFIEGIAKKEFKENFTVKRIAQQNTCKDTVEFLYSIQVHKEVLKKKIVKILDDEVKSVVLDRLIPTSNGYKVKHDVEPCQKVSVGTTSSYHVADTVEPMLDIPQSYFNSDTVTASHALTKIKQTSNKNETNTVTMTKDEITSIQKKKKKRKWLKAKEIFTKSDWSFEAKANKGNEIGETASKQTEHKNVMQTKDCKLKKKRKIKERF